jgi:hypothetical protein
MTKMDILWCALGYMLSIVAAWWVGYNSGHSRAMLDMIDRR